MGEGGSTLQLTEGGFCPGELLSVGNLSRGILFGGLCPGGLRPYPLRNTYGSLCYNFKLVIYIHILCMVDCVNFSSVFFGGVFHE